MDKDTLLQDLEKMVSHVPLDDVDTNEAYYRIQEFINQTAGKKEVIPIILKKQGD